MVSPAVDRALVPWLVAALLIVSAAPSLAAVVARVDRPSVELNESFLLEVTVDASTDLEPDLSPLDTDFYRGRISELSNTTIVNGQIRRSVTWSVPLMAKSTGTLTIPPISVGSESSQPVTIEVTEPKTAPPGEADVFVTSEVDQAEAYVQSQILYRIKVYRAVQTRQPTLRNPEIAGAETLVELSGDDRSYEAILNDKPYNVHERVMAFYPQESGEISISAARFEARVLRDGRITGRKVFDSTPHTVVVKPIPAPPAEYPDAAWLPARDVQLSEDWSREPDAIDVGEPVTRHVTISALGQLETQIPALPAPQIDGMNVYGDKPDLSREIEAEGIRGIRRDQYALIGVRGGSVEVPDLVVPWWNIETEQWQVARLPGRSIEVRGTAAVVPDSQPPSAAEPAPVDATEPVLLPQAGDGRWKLATQVLGVLWLVTAAGWWWSSRDRQRVPREPAPPPIYKQQAKFVKAARKAATAGDAVGVKAALLQWGRLEWPDNPPRSVGEFASRVTAPLSDELASLSAASYGRGDRQWNGSALASALRKITPLPNATTSAADDPLPPLMPQ